MEQLYCIEELVTTGWELVKDNLTRVEAVDTVESLLQDGYNPTRLRIREVT